MSDDLSSGVPMNMSAPLDAHANQPALLPPSLPALRHALAHGISPHARAEEMLDELRHVVQVYRIGRGNSIEAEAAQALHVMRHLLDRLGRLRGAYGEWRTFDAPAYFDLSHNQTQLLLDIQERVSGIHVLVHGDLLLPTVQELLAFWATSGIHARPHTRAAQEEHERYLEQIVPGMARRWDAAVAVITQTRNLLAGDADYLAANGSAEERWRWRDEESGKATAREANAIVGTPIAQIPTLALTIDFPLPTWRQAGRMRRLRRNRDRRYRRSHRP